MRSKSSLGFETVIAVMKNFWDITPCSPVKVTGVSEEHAASIFRVEEYAKQ
jgi:hypothetical protein